MKDKKNGYSIEFVLWIVFYCYSTFAALVFQKLVLPLFPNFHGGSGLIGGGDSAFFNQVAIGLADSIRTYGWDKWTLYPAEGATGNVSLLAALYVVFGDDPTVIIPVNAAVHATSGLFIFLLARLMWPGKVGIYSGVIAGLLFIVFPSALNWYAQIHKDGFSIMGMIIIFYSWIRGIQNSSRLKSASWIILGTFVGLLLMIFVRPYNIKLFVVSGSLTLIVSLIYLWATRQLRNRYHIPLCFVLLIIVFMSINIKMPHWATVNDVVDSGAISEIAAWHPEKKITVIDRMLGNAAQIRFHNIKYGQKVKARSLLDADVRPENSWSVIGYMPRALWIAVLAPFPSMWFDNFNITRLVSMGEMLIVYMIVPGMLLGLWYRRNNLVFLLLALNSILFLGIYGFTLPNVGTLYRIRYLFLFFLLLIGIMGWAEFIRRKYGGRIKRFLSSIRKEDLVPAAEPDQEKPTYQKRTTIATAGAMVILFTLLSNMLFVVRDIILARWFGLSNELDTFFIALIVPMFFVTVLSMPIGTVMVPALLRSFKESKHQASEEMIRSCSTILLYAMLLICAGLVLLSPYYLPVLGWGFSAQKVLKSRLLELGLMPLLFFSGFVILGNSLLNARGKFILPALIQSIVPIIAILSLLFFARRMGVYAMALGMGIGQLANLFIVGYFVRKEGFDLRPVMRFGEIKETISAALESSKHLFAQYVPLIFSSFFLSLILPVNNVIASSLNSGSVSAFNLGTKFVLFFTGLIGTAISTVMLPHFSSFFARNWIIDVKRELSFFLFLMTIISVSLSMVIYFATDYAVKFIFGGGLISGEGLGTLTRVIEYGIIQLPFFCTNMLFAKYANAKRKNALIMVSSLLGLTVNIALSLVLVTRMGVGGIALASSLSLLVATALFLVIGHRYNDIKFVDVVFITLTWLLFLTILMCDHFQSMSGVIIASSSLMITVAYYFIEFLEGNKRLAIGRSG